MLGLVIGLAGGVAGSYAYWGRRVAAAEERRAALEATAAQVQGERERLHHELTDIVRERQEMADTAEHLRAQVDRQLHRLQALAEDLEAHSDNGEPAEEPPTAPAP